MDVRSRSGYRGRQASSAAWSTSHGSALRGLEGARERCPGPLGSELGGTITRRSEFQHKDFTMLDHAVVAEGPCSAAEAAGGKVPSEISRRGSCRCIVSNSHLLRPHCSSSWNTRTTMRLPFRPLCREANGRVPGWKMRCPVWALAHQNRPRLISQSDQLGNPPSNPCATLFYRRSNHQRPLVI